MKRKVIALLLAFALPLNSCNLFCNAHYYYDSDPDYAEANIRVLEEKIKKLKEKQKFAKKASDLEKDKEIKRLKQKIKQLKETEESEPSFWASVWENTKDIFETILSSAAGIGLSFAVLAPIFMTVSASYDCATDDKCHFNDKSFFSKFNIGSAGKLMKVILKNVNFIFVKEKKTKK